jgi:hypothetical protein
LWLAVSFQRSFRVVDASSPDLSSRYSLASGCHMQPASLVLIGQSVPWSAVPSRESACPRRSAFDSFGCVYVSWQFDNSTIVDRICLGHSHLGSSYHPTFFVPLHEKFCFNLLTSKHLPRARILAQFGRRCLFAVE